MREYPSVGKALRDLEGTLKAMAHRRRLMILGVLRRSGQIHVGALAEELRLPLKTVSRNLRLLERARLVLSDQHGVYVYYRLNPDAPSPAGPVIETIVRDDDEGRLEVRPDRI